MCLSTYASNQNTFTTNYVPCGKCSACINRKKKYYITRCYFEAKSHFSSVFVTFTYSNENLPLVPDPQNKNNYNSSLDPEHMTKFFKRLRKHFSKEDRKIRYFYSGEYGSKTKRPHYHAVIFGCSVDDFLSFDNHRNITNNTMDKIWTLGNTRVEEFKPNHARYVVGYVSKKMGDLSDFLTPEQIPEFVRMSTRPPLGHDGLTLFAKNLLDKDSPFSKYYSTKHFSTLYRYILSKMIPEYKTFPSVLFHSRPDKKGSRGTISMIDTNDLNENEISFRIERFQKHQYSFFHLDRISSRIINDTLHPDLTQKIETALIQYVQKNSNFLTYDGLTLKKAIQYFNDGYDEQYKQYCQTSSDLHKKDVFSYETSLDYDLSFKHFDKQHRIALSKDSH